LKFIFDEVLAKRAELDDEAKEYIVQKYSHEVAMMEFDKLDIYADMIGTTKDLIIEKAKETFRSSHTY
jgi:hypothetical protein